MANSAVIDKAELCGKIQDIYPDIGECGIDVDVDYDERQGRWVVDLRKDNKHLKTFLEEADAEMCLAGRQCIGLSFQIAQLRSNIAQK